jgi:hypothetical protein
MEDKETIEDFDDKLKEFISNTKNEQYFRYDFASLLKKSE